MPKTFPTKCGHCDADLTKPNAVTVAFNDGSTYGDAEGQVAADGTLTGDAAQYIDSDPDYTSFACGLCAAPLEPEEPKTWINSRGLDAETLVNISHHLISDLWQSHEASHDHSYIDYCEFLYQVCEAFQIKHLDTDWEAKDFWESIDDFCDKVKKLMESPDHFLGNSAAELVKLTDAMETAGAT